MSTRRSKLRRRDPGHAALLPKIDDGQPWERPEHDLHIDLKLYELLTGFDHLGGGFPTLDDTRDAWTLVRDAMTREHARRRPGTRPWAWWTFDAPEPRRLIDGTPDRVSPAAVTWLGMPSAHACTYESEAAYLRRLGLLLPGEPPDATDPAQPPDAGTRYAHDVVNHRVPACQAIRWACRRHLDDLDHAWRRGYFYDWRAAAYRIAFNRYVRHFQGPAAGDVFRPQPWQCFRSGSMWGWMDAEAWRRFSDVFTFVQRKTGKTFEAAVDSLFATVADGESSPEVYAVATKRDQASKVVKDAIGIRLASPLIREATRSSRRLIKGPKWVACDLTGGMFETLASDAEKELGNNISFGVVDEAAAHPDDSNARQVRDSMGGRGQQRIGQIGTGGGPMMSVITTAGTDHEAYGGQVYDLAKRILDPEDDTELDSMFCFVAELDDRDDWSNPGAWAAAIPNLGVAKSQKDLQKMVDAALQDAGKLADLLIYHFNRWEVSTETWLSWENWKRCADPGVDAVRWRQEQLEDLVGERCFPGLDLADRFDMNCLQLFFPDIEPRPVVLPFYWIPEDNLRQRVRRDRVPYDRWQARGFLRTTPGSETKLDWIAADIEELAEAFEFQPIHYDPWKAKSIVKLLEAAGIECTLCRQAMPTLSEPSARLEGMVRSEAFDHGANRVLNWNARNAVAKRDPSGNVMPDKSKSQRKRIDGISAFVNALRGWIDVEEDDDIAAWREELAEHA